MSIWLGNKRLDGGSARNVGDIFYTTRKDSGLGGAVECNGGTYSTADYAGAGSIGELLAAGKLDYISLSDYATAISTKGYCDKIGWDGTGTTAFRVPTLTPRRYVVKVQEPTADNNYTWYRLYNDGWVEQGGRIPKDTTSRTVVVSLPVEMESVYFYAGVSLSYNAASNSVNYAQASTWNHTTTSFEIRTHDAASKKWQVIGQSAIVSDPTERAMFQLFNGTTDEAVATVGTVVAQVGENTTQIANRVIKGHEVIAFQAPTAENGYTWYRKYADGWVEQGGICPSLGYTVTFPVTMADTNYTALGTARNTSSNYAIRIQDITVTGMKLNSSATNTHAIWWTVSGIAA